MALLEISWPGTILNVTEGVLETASSLDLDEGDSISSSSGRSRSNSEENSLEYESFEEEEGEGENNDDNNNNIEGGDTDTEIKEEETEYRNPPQKFSASVNENLIEPRKSAFLSVISRDKRLPFNWRKASTSIKKSPKISRYYLKPGYYSTIDDLLDKVCQKACKTKNKNSWPFSHGPLGLLDSKQHETKIDDSTTNADNFYANEDDDDANGEIPPVASIRLISSDMQNILGTKCLRWAEAKEEEDGGGGGGSSMKESSSSSDSVEWLSRSSQSTSSKWPTYPVDIMGGCHTIFVYCDLIQDEVFGDKRTSLLRSVTLNETNASATTCYRSFSKLQWKTVVKSSFQSISISLRNETGSLVPFLARGRTTLTLKFRHISKI